MNKQTIVLILVFAGVLLLSGLASHFIVNRPSTRVSESRATSTNDEPSAALPVGQASDARQQDAQQQSKRGGSSFFSQLFGSEDPDPQSGDAATATVQIVLRFSLAALLAAMLAFRPRKRHLAALKRNPYVVQTQILLAVVASALMMVVGDSAARAFGIFAAASLVRFRTNIRDPKEITVLLISLAIGLATGVGRWEVALVLAFFVLLTLWVLEYFESSMVYRAMELKIATRNVEATNESLRTIFRRHKFNAELRVINHADEKEPLGSIVYHVNVGANVSTDQISEEIASSDPLGIDAIEWHETKTASYIYG
ncbi:MAG TPA: DUF4956 domain-containing protein [Pyrinomonadaceae bacterium]|jgi:uncharacterized membrane protein YhiD involved in acid resistance|nr:DUF4956 domain-containing protein [Pyrinomonadaceae bacterium]